MRYPVIGRISISPRLIRMRLPQSQRLSEGVVTRPEPIHRHRQQQSSSLLWRSYQTRSYLSAQESTIVICNRVLISSDKEEPKGDAKKAFCNLANREASDSKKA